MFINLIKLLGISKNINMSTLASQLQYKSYPAFHKVISGKDIRLTVLLAICNACNCDIIITNHSTININIAQYYQQAKQEQEQQTTSD